MTRPFRFPRIVFAAGLLAIAFSAVVIAALPPVPVQAQFRATLTPTPDPVLILSPGPGDILQGSVPVIAQSDVPGFQSAELSFTYASDLTGTWFLLAETGQPARQTVIFTWDTSEITDGEYDLRLQVFFRNSPPREVIISGLRVRNYSPVETSTAAPSPTFDPGLPTETRTPTASPAAPTSTPLPTNPAIPGRERTLASLGVGIASVFMIFAAFGIYLTWRSRQRRG